MNVNLLIEVKEIKASVSKIGGVGKYYHLFPSRGGVGQEQNMAFLGSGQGFLTKHLYQKDGSRFKTIYTKLLGPVDIVKRIERGYPGQKIIWVESRRDAPKDLLSAATGTPDEEWVYVTFVTHAFLNGFRCFPVVINYTRKTCYNLSPLFSEFIPEDAVGVLVEDTYDLGIEGLGAPVDIHYYAKKRMCPCCGVVSDVTRPRKYPWGS